MAIPAEGVPGVVEPAYVAQARNVTGEDLHRLRDRLFRYLRAQLSRTDVEYLEALHACRSFPHRVYRSAQESPAPASPLPTQSSPESRIAALRAAAADLDCLGGFQPSPSEPSAAQLAATLRARADQLEAELLAAQAEEASCLADPKCVKQRRLENILGELCSVLAEIDEIEARLKERLKEAKKYGVINKADQYDDMEDKQFYEERAAELKRDYREVAGKNFARKVCRQYD